VELLNYFGFKSARVRRSPFLVSIHYSQSGDLLLFNKYHSIYIQLLYLYYNIESLKTLRGNGRLSVLRYGVKLI